MVTKYKNTSVYKNTRLTDNYLDIYVPPIIPDFNNVRELTIIQKYNNRPDLLAYDLYGESSLWWIFSLYNRDIITDPLFDFKSGMTIFVPKSINNIGI